MAEVGEAERDPVPGGEVQPELGSELQEPAAAASGQDTVPAAGLVDDSPRP